MEQTLPPDENSSYDGRLLSFLPIVLLACSWLGIPSACADDQIVTVGVYENAPKIFVSASGKPEGIFIDIIEYIASQEGWELRYVSGTWEEGLDRLARGEIDLMPDVAYTADREKIYTFHKVPALFSWLQVYTPKGSNVQSVLDLNNKRVLVLERSVQQEAFVRLSKSFGLNISLISVPDYATMFQMVSKGEADAVITNHFYGLMHAKNFGLEDTPVIFEPSELFFAAPLNAPRQLPDTIDRHLLQLKSDLQSVYYASLKRWTSEHVRIRFPLWLKGAGFVIAGLLLLSLLWSVVLKRQVAIRTQDLALRNEQIRSVYEEMKHLVQELRENVHKYRTLFETASDAILLMRGDRFIDCNARALTMYGCTREQIIGIPPYGFSPPMQPDGRPSMEKALERINLALTDGPQFFEWQHRRRDGTLFMAEVSLNRLELGEETVLQAIVRDITERKHIEERLAESERQYRELVEEANPIILRMTSDGRITFLNEFGQRFFGYSAEEIVGHHIVGTIVPETETGGRDLGQLMEQICANPKAFEQNVNENIRRNGERVWISWANRIMLDDQEQPAGILSVGTDITERKKAEEALQESESTIRGVFLAAPVGICIMKDRLYKSANKYWCEQFRYPEETILGKTTRMLYDSEEEYNRVGQALYADLQEKGLASVETRLRRSDGTMRDVIVTAAPLRADDLSAGTIAIIHDITERRQAEKEIHRLHEDLQRHAADLECRVAERTAELATAMERAMAADRIKSAFLATMSHELRTPLNSIIGFTGILLQGLAGPLNQEQQKQLAMVQNSSRHLLALINDVLDISKIEAGQLDLSIASFDLRSSVEKMVKLVSPLAEKKGIDLRLDISDGVGTIVSDQRRLEQVILNLINNAIKFTDKGHVHLSCRTENDHYSLLFADTGIGMKPEEIPSLFQPFHQIDTGLARKHEGTGLGLSICRKIVDLMGGSITVESQWGQGSTFTVRIPKQPGGLL